MRGVLRSWLLLGLVVSCAAPAKPVNAPLPLAGPPAIDASVEAPSALEQRLETALVPAVQIVGEEAPAVSLAQLMAELNVPGLSLAVCEHEQVVWAKGYGLAQAEQQRPVTSNTLFQAGSISKSVNALGVLLSASRGAFSLDAPVNGLLHGWALPENDLTRRSPVTLRRLLSHTAGTTVHGFPGYPTGAPLPTLPQVLDGAAPANTPPVRVDLLPGSAFRYSGGGITITQLVLMDQLSKPYPALLEELVLGPLGMASSTYEQPLPRERLALAAAGYGPDGAVIASERHVYPEMAAAGLWTTPTDLATFFCELGRARAGRSSKVSQAIAREMTTEVDAQSHVGLGVFLSERNGAAFFGHGGVDEGFQASAQASLDGGFALVMMANSANGMRLFPAVERTVFSTLGWPGADAPIARAPLGEEARQRWVGNYLLADGTAVSIAARGPLLFFTRPFAEPAELVPIAADTLIHRELGWRATLREGEGFDFSSARGPGGRARRLPLGASLGGR